MQCCSKHCCLVNVDEHSSAVACLTRTLKKGSASGVFMCSMRHVMPKMKSMHFDPRTYVAGYWYGFVTSDIMLVSDRNFRSSDCLVNRLSLELIMMMVL
jgi:hypothetical protein